MITPKIAKKLMDEATEGEWSSTDQGKGLSVVHFNDSGYKFSVVVKIDRRRDGNRDYIDRTVQDAKFIAALPEIAAAYIKQAEENEALRAHVDRLIEAKELMDIAQTMDCSCAIIDDCPACEMWQQIEEMLKEIPAQSLEAIKKAERERCMNACVELALCDAGEEMRQFDSGCGACVEAIRAMEQQDDNTMPNMQRGNRSSILPWVQG